MTYFEKLAFCNGGNLLTVEHSNIAIGSLVVYHRWGILEWEFSSGQWFVSQSCLTHLDSFNTVTLMVAFHGAFSYAHHVKLPLMLW